MNPLVEVWRSIITGDQKSRVLFSNGTCVILTEPEEDLAAQAIALMKEWGPVHAGSSAGDFGTIKLSNFAGWAVTSHHDDILTYVGPDEVEASECDDMVVGLVGRAKRDQDARQLVVIHLNESR
jgi:hypothetical protein